MQCLLSTESLLTRINFGATSLLKQYPEIKIILTEHSGERLKLARINSKLPPAAVFKVFDFIKTIGRKSKVNKAHDLLFYESFIGTFQCYNVE